MDMIDLRVSRIIEQVSKGEISIDSAEKESELVDSILEGLGDSPELSFASLIPAFRPGVRRLVLQVSRTKRSDFFALISRFLLDFYRRLGFDTRFDDSEYFRCHEKIYAKDPKWLRNEYFSLPDENDLENPFFSIDVLNFSVSLYRLTGPSRAEPHRGSLFQSSLQLISLYSHSKKAQHFLRVHKILKSLLDAAETLLSDSEPRQPTGSLENLDTILSILAKLTFRNANNQAFFLQYKGKSLASELLSDPRPACPSLTNHILAILINCASTPDLKIDIWTSELYEKILSISLKALQSIPLAFSSEPSPPRLHQATLWLKLLSNLSLDSEETMLSIFSNESVIDLCVSTLLGLTSLQNLPRTTPEKLQFASVILDFFSNRFRLIYRSCPDGLAGHKAAIAKSLVDLILAFGDFPALSAPFARAIFAFFKDFSPYELRSIGFPIQKSLEIVENFADFSKISKEALALFAAILPLCFEIESSGLENVRRVLTLIASKHSAKFSIMSRILALVSGQQGPLSLFTSPLIFKAFLNAFQTHKANTNFTRQILRYFRLILSQNGPIDPYISLILGPGHREGVLGTCTELIGQKELRRELFGFLSLVFRDERSVAILEAHDGFREQLRNWVARSSEIGEALEEETAWIPIERLLL